MGLNSIGSFKQFIRGLLKLLKTRINLNFQFLLMKVKTNANNTKTERIVIADLLCKEKLIIYGINNELR